MYIWRVLFLILKHHFSISLNTSISLMLRLYNTSGYKLLNSFFNHIFFYSYNHSSLNNCIAYLKFLNYLCLEAVSSLSTLVIVTDASTISLRNMLFLWFLLLLIVSLCLWRRFLSPKKKTIDYLLCIVYHILQSSTI